jgi:hypothetical protein
MPIDPGLETGCRLLQLHLNLLEGLLAIEHEYRDFLRIYLSFSWLPANLSRCVINYFSKRFIVSNGSNYRTDAVASNTMNIVNISHHYLNSE